MLCQSSWLTLCGATKTECILHILLPGSAKLPSQAILCMHAGAGQRMRGMGSRRKPPCGTCCACCMSAAPPPTAALLRQAHNLPAALAFGIPSLTRAHSLQAIQDPAKGDHAAHLLP